MAPKAAKDRADTLRLECGPAALTNEQEEKRLRGLRILARIIARHQLVDSEVRSGNSCSALNKSRLGSDHKEDAR